MAFSWKFGKDKNPEASKSEGAPSLDFERLYKMADDLAEGYKTAHPFPSAVIEGLFDTSFLKPLVECFPDPGKKLNWRRAEAELEGVKMQHNKLGMPHELEMPAPIRQLILELNSGAFINFLERLSGIKGLLPDPSLQGGGMHQILPGGVLGVHADFTHHKIYGLDRRINVLIYLNKDWRPEYGGHLELWSRDMKRCERRIMPTIGRCVIFNTDADSFHGHPEVISCPEGMTRKSIALYYYTNGREDEVATTQATDWQLLPETSKPILE